MVWSVGWCLRVGPQALPEVQVPRGGQVVVFGPEGSVFFCGGELEVVSPDMVDLAERGSSGADDEALCWEDQWGILWYSDGRPP